ncbi:MAG: lamin tail domain-containing protein [Candidatus Hydrogenedentota bacterium]|nr:MAG: lamin tail domain-containing protein [Candidatus Hydrogenedentota bacterium]
MSLFRPRTMKRGDSGFALVIALMLMVMAVFMVTTYASVLQANAGSGTRQKGEVESASAATAAIYRVAGELLADTNVVTPDYADSRIVVTEVLFQAAKTEGLPDTLVISQVTPYGPGGSTDEWVEIYNPTSETVSLKGLNLRRASDGAKVTKSDFPNTSVIAPYSYYLMARLQYNPALYAGNVVADSKYKGTTSLTSTTGVVLRYGNSGAIVDAVGWNGTVGEGTPLPAPVNKATVKRKNDDAYGAIVDSNDNASDFFPWSTTDTAPRNSATPPKLPPVPGPNADRRNEFIEIQNTDSKSIDLVADQYWIVVGDANAPLAKRRYLYPIDGGADTLGPYEVGLIVALDADSAKIAQMSGKTTADIRWFGTGPSGSGPTDTMIGRINGTTYPTNALQDTGDIIVIGYGGAAKPQWYGVAFPDGIPSGGTDTSWKRHSEKVSDDNVSPYDGFDATNWETGTADPGIAFSVQTTGVDGAPDLGWYPWNDTPWTQIGEGIYYRVRVFDEAAKVNLNTIQATNTVSDSLFRELLAIKPMPPFTGVTAYSSVAINNLSNELIANWKSAGASNAKLLSPSSQYLIHPAGASFRKYWYPYFTVYGYSETDAEKININMAETPVLAAGFRYALESDITSSQASAIAEKVYQYLTNTTSPTTYDTNPYNDGYYESVSDIATKTSGLTASEKAALNANLTDLDNTFRTTSTGYFTIWAMGYVYQGQNIDPNADTPLARSSVIAVVRRKPGYSKGNIVYWREVSEDDVVRFPISEFSRRYPRFAWDPIY